MSASLTQDRSEEIQEFIISEQTAEQFKQFFFFSEKKKNSPSFFYFFQIIQSFYLYKLFDSMNP